MQDLTGGSDQGFAAHPKEGELEINFDGGENDEEDDHLDEERGEDDWGDDYDDKESIRDSG